MPMITLMEVDTTAYSAVTVESLSTKTLQKLYVTTLDASVYLAQTETRSELDEIR